MWELLCKEKVGSSSLTPSTSSTLSPETSFITRAIMGNGASKKYDAVDLSHATIHSTDGIPDALVPSTCAQAFEAKKQAVTLQNWIFASTTNTTTEVSFEQTQRMNPEKYQFNNRSGDTKETLATIASKAGWGYIHLLSNRTIIS